MSSIFRVGDRVQYNSKSHHGCPIEGIIEELRDTDADPLLSGKPQSRYLATICYTAPITGATRYAQVYCHRLSHC